MKGSRWRKGGREEGREAAVEREGGAGRKGGDRKREEAGGREEEIAPAGVRRDACPICGCSNEKS